MNRIHLILAVIMSIIISGCGSTGYLPNKRAYSIQQGMSRKEVISILGEPDFRRFDGDVEELEFQRYTGPVMLGSTPITILVLLVNGEVESMNSFDTYTPQQPAPQVVISPSVNERGEEYTNPHANIRLRAMGNDEFNRFLTGFKDATFNSSRKEIIEKMSPSTGFTCYQCGKIVDLYTFDSEKKEWIRRLAPKIIDTENQSVLLDRFTFESEKRELRDYINSFQN